MRTVAIVQAHMSSTRLPGKVLLDIAGACMLERVIMRLRRVALIDEVIVACATDAADDVLVSACDLMGVRVHRGSNDDVLDRFHGAAERFQADVIVRITSDCPLIDPGITTLVIDRFHQTRPDYASNTIDRSYPRGLDTEVFTRTALDRSWREAIDSYQRVHVTPYLYENPKLFQNVQVRDAIDRSSYRWTVDTPEDLEFVRRVYNEFDGRDDFAWTDVLQLLERHPELSEINRDIKQKSLREG